MQARTSASSSKLAQAHSCQRCAVRKVRCDKQQPCTACLRHNVECEYRTPPPPRRRTKASRDDLLNKRSAVAERPQQRHDPDAIASRGLSAHSPSSLTTEHASLTAQDTSAVQVPHSTTATPIGFVPKLQRSKYLFKSIHHPICVDIANIAAVVYGQGWQIRYGRDGTWPYGHIADPANRSPSPRRLSDILQTKMATKTTTLL